MRRLLLAMAALALGGAVRAQSLLGQSAPGQSGIAVPPAPPVVAAPSAPTPPPAPAPSAPPPGLVQTPLPPPSSPAAATGDEGAPASQPSLPEAVSPSAPSAAPAQPAPPDVPPPPPNSWVPGKTAIIGVLNKVDGSSGTITVPVGGQTQTGDLILSVQACLSRPPGALPDAAVFLTLEPKASPDAAAVYRGWIVRSAPGAADPGNAVQAFRVISCS
ncbi:DUF2155 domain-containing protein [Acidocella sp.]|uniref:DUF2155 domain-containing protein n=1 Tax=Acidocella sp. TaxID=50710 RepID=UPI002627F28D|nr:DUF2155 domain-containing protein [Acidocella sp.]